MMRPAASMRARWEKAWGKLPRWKPVSTSNSSAYNPSGEAMRRRRSNRSRAFCCGRHQRGPRRSHPPDDQPRRRRSPRLHHQDPRAPTNWRGPDRAWVSAVVAVEKYRVEHGVTDSRGASAKNLRITSTPSIGTGSTTSCSVPAKPSSDPRPPSPGKSRLSTVRRSRSACEGAGLLVELRGGLRDSSSLAPIAESGALAIGSSRSALVPHASPQAGVLGQRADRMIGAATGLVRTSAERAFGIATPG